MIFYRPTDGDAHTVKVVYRPKTCFLMTQLGKPVPKIIKEIRASLDEICSRFNISIIDAESTVTGRDFLMKIWGLLLCVPLGIAIVHEKMSHKTFANIFYEIGMMQAYGKETLVIKTEGTSMPSDFVRTEYIVFDSHFEEQLTKFLESFLNQGTYYLSVADELEKNPLLAIDYLRRAYLISGETMAKERAKRIYEKAGIM